MYRGDIRLGDTIDLKFTTRSFSTGAPTQLAGTPVISAYPNNSTTQITAGITLTVDFDTVTGLNHVRVVATSGNGYATATNYDLVITTGTVGGVSVVGEVVGSFSIEARSALMPTTAARTLDVSATGEAGIDWANIGSPTTAVNLSGTNIDTDQVVASVSGAVGSVTGNVGGNVTGSVGSVATGGITSGSFAAGAINAAAIAADAIGASELAADAVAEIADAVWDEARAGHVAAGSFGEGVASVQGSVTGSVASVTGNVGGNVTGSVGSVATGGISAASFAANAIDSAALAASAVTEIQSGLSTLDAAGVRAAVGLASANLDTQLDALPTAAEITDAVWDEATSGHTTAGTTGKALTDAGSAGDPWATALPGAYGAGTAGKIIGDNLNATVSSRASQTSVDTIDDFLDTEVAAILADTNELQTDWTNGGRLDLLVDAIKAKTDNLPAAPAAVGDIPTATENADALLGRNVSGGSSTGRTVKQALHVLRNKSVIGAGTLTVYDTDDTTTSFTATVTTAAGDPISGIDPA